jgi:type 1 glutamine amidotransferase
MTLTKGYHHESVELSKQIVKEIGEKSGAFDTTVTEDVGAFTKENLKTYDAVMFNTTGELPMTDEEKGAFADFIRSGHGFVGVHSATDTFYTWGTYGDIIGGWFNNHPWHEMVTIDVVDPKSNLVGFLGNSFQINDEIYQISDFKAETTHVLLQLDPKSVNTQKEAARIRYYGWPVAWTRMFGKGRVYYNSLGHDDWVWKDQRYQEMLLKAIKWVMREED